MASDFYVAGFATIDEKRVAAVMRVVLSDQGSVAAVKWMATVAVDTGAAQPYKLASVVGDDGAPMVALVGAFEKNASTTDGSWAGQCDKQRCAFVAAWHSNGEFAFARVIRATGAASSSPLLIASHGANIIITGPSTSTTSVGCDIAVPLPQP